MNNLKDIFGFFTNNKRDFIVSFLFEKINFYEGRMHEHIVGKF